MIAGVPDRDEAQNAVNFATSVELLRKPEVQKLQLAEIKLSDGSSIAAALPKWVLASPEPFPSPGKAYESQDCCTYIPGFQGLSTAISLDQMQSLLKQGASQ